MPPRRWPTRTRALPAMRGSAAGRCCWSSTNGTRYRARAVTARGFWAQCSGSTRRLRTCPLSSCRHVPARISTSCFWRSTACWLPTAGRCVPWNSTKCWQRRPVRKHRRAVAASDPGFSTRRRLALRHHSSLSFAAILSSSPRRTNAIWRMPFATRSTCAGRRSGCGSGPVHVNNPEPVAPLHAAVDGIGGPRVSSASVTRDESTASATLQYLGVALVMMSNLMLELLLTRIFSATMWYHFAFMAVSIALFGTTVGAVIVHLWPRHFSVADGGRLAARYALGYAGAIVACMLLQLHFNVTFGATWPELAKLAALYVVVAVPFTLSGIFMCMMLIQPGARVGEVYGADLIGAAVGCAVFVPFSGVGQGPR